MLLRLRFCAFALIALGLCSSPSLTHAQNNKIEADFKGAVGLGLVGAELGAIVPALAGMDSTWAYLVFPAVGAAGGAVAGYFALDRAGHVELSVAALTAGMALVIPALIGTLQLTSYDVPDAEPAPGSFVRRGSDTKGRVQSAAARSPRTPSAAQRARRRLAAGTGMLRVSEGALALAAPGFALLPATSGGSVVSGVSFSLMSGQF